MSGWFLVSYDVRDDRRLRRVARKLEGYGTRLQYSLFRCRLSERSSERLRWEVTKLMAPEDSLLIVSLCVRCAAKIRTKGCEEGWPVSEPGFVIL